MLRKKSNKKELKPKANDGNFVTSRAEKKRNDRKCDFYLRSEACASVIVNNCPSPSKPLIYMAGPLFNTAERSRQDQITCFLQCQGFQVFLPQRDGLEIGPLTSQLETAGVECPDIIAGAAITDLDLYWVARADILIMTANGIEVDSGTVVEATTAYCLGIPVIIYFDDIRTFAATALLNPLVLNLSRYPIVSDVQEHLVPTILKALSRPKSKPLAQLAENIRKGKRISRNYSAQNVIKVEGESC
jgi:nucleoside 2-deoxyribosyltransferase